MFLVHHQTNIKQSYYYLTLKAGLFDQLQFSTNIHKNRVGFDTMETNLFVSIGKIKSSCLPMMIYIEGRHN